MSERWPGARPYQVAALEAVERRAVPRGIVAMATGTGKTVVASHLPDVLGTDRVLYLVHKHELATQMLKHLMPVLGSVGLEMASSRAGGARSVVASRPTLGAAGGRRLEAFDPGQFGAIVYDEAQHATDETSLTIFRHFGLLRLEEFPDPKTGKVRTRHVKTENPSTHLIGLTATPSRGDGVGLSNVFDDILYQYELARAIRDGYLVPIHAHTIRTGTSLEQVHTHGKQGDYKENELALAVDTQERNGQVFEAWEAHAKGLKTLGFGVTVAHAQHLADTFTARGANARWISGAPYMTDEERKRTLTWFRSTPAAVLFNVQIFEEGVDVPSIEAVLLSAPTRSTTRFAQRIGRGTRLAAGARDIAESVERGKARCLLLDVTDSTETIGRRAVNILDIVGAPLPGEGLNGEDVLEVVAEQQAILESEAKAQKAKKAKKTGSFDLFAPAEQLPGCSLRWFRIGAEGLGLALPDGSILRVQTNALDQWTVERREGKRAGWEPWAERFETRDQAVGAAEVLMEYAFESQAPLIRASAGWRKRPPTEGQLALAAARGIPVPRDEHGNPTVTSGQVSDAIDRAKLAPRRRSA